MGNVINAKTVSIWSKSIAFTSASLKTISFIRLATVKSHKIWETSQTPQNVKNAKTASVYKRTTQFVMIALVASLLSLKVN